MELDFYEAKQVAELLKMSVPTVYRKAKSGDIPAVGKRPNIKFPKEAIDALVEFGDEEELNTRLVFEPCTNAELWQGLEITRSLYGTEDEVPYKRLIEWQRANKDIFMCLRGGKNLVGAITFMPIDEKIAISLIHDEIREKDIPGTAVKKWTDKGISVYVPTIEVISSGNIKRDRERGQFLLRRTIKWAIMLTIQHDIKNWYAIGATPEGQAILEALGFTKATELDNGKRKGYMLDTSIEPVKLVSRFINEIEMGRNTTLPQKAESLKSGSR
jgi:excisionase family DNA binding protein